VSSHVCYQQTHSPGMRWPCRHACCGDPWAVFGLCTHACYGVNGVCKCLGVLRQQHRLSCCSVHVCRRALWGAGVYLCLLLPCLVFCVGMYVRLQALSRGFESIAPRPSLVCRAFVVLGRSRLCVAPSVPLSQQRMQAAGVAREHTRKVCCAGPHLYCVRPWCCGGVYVIAASVLWFVWRTVWGPHQRQVRVGDAMTAADHAFGS
jgi:hypothetical protein